ncbi:MULTISPECIES: CidA/LrgA family protein [unclassified Vibrio]|uniref:CidA/LrgA family protein n=1 Tax=Vibrio sp. HB236076 TaxID=3232307 RepID=A0AB39HCF6_9VIBR|nr:CidA/LrgA family protein [Vibrio sp. HB161653]MDP5253473.1 CidA/LrgA family protein [Vibrio sp. HB161653]
MSPYRQTALTFMQFTRSLALIYAALAVGNTLQTLSSVAIPGSVLGMIFLFGLLVSGVVPVEWVKPAASLFIRYMVVLFIPISVGLIDHLPLLLNNAVGILASAVGGSAIVMVVLSRLVDHLLKQRA